MKKLVLNHKWLLAATVLFSLLFSLLSVGIAFVLQNILDAATSQNWPLFRNMVFVTLAYIPVIGLFQFLYGYCGKRLIYKVLLALRQNVFSGILARDAQSFSQTNTADYISALTNDIKTIEESYLNSLLDIMCYGMVFIATIAALLFVSPLVTLFLLVCTVFMYILPSLFGKPLQKRQNKLSGLYSAFTVKTKDILSGYEVVKSFQMDQYAAQTFNSQNKAVSDTKLSLDTVTVANEGLSTLLSFGTQMALLLVAGWLILTGNITAGILLGLVELSGGLVQPISLILSRLPLLAGAKPVVQRMEALSAPPPSAFTGSAAPTFQHAIRTENLSFEYHPGQPVLQGVSLTFQKNKKYAITGPSGCGKSTLVKLLTANYGTYQGGICYDSKELHTLNVQQLQQYFSLIHQNVYMFDETIRQNICLHNQYTPQQLQQALEGSGATSFINNAPQGLNSPVGENGSLLSGGQRQRIAVARALIQNKPLLILDEGTSSVDQQTAYDIETRLLSLPHLTMVTITHNLSPALLSQYDEVIYMEQGQIKAQGNFHELLNTSEAFTGFCALHSKNESVSTT